jgi:hypothetical protein
MMNETATFRFFNQPTNSKVQESAAEYQFLHQLLVQAAAQGLRINVCRGDFDAFGFDLLLRLGPTTRLVQMKARSGGRDGDGYWDIHNSLLDNPDGIIICARLHLRPATPTLPEPQIHYQYKLFDRVANGETARRRAPIKAHDDKCQIKEHECVDITEDLLQLFA